MDAYLESLVRKDEEPVYTPEEVVPASEDFEPLPDEPEEAVVETVPEEVGEPQQEESEPVEEPTQEEKPESKPEEVAQVKEGEVISVNNIRVYKTPDTNQVARNITGNVTYLGKVGNFAIINYMRSGFGLVKGFTPDL